MFLQASVILSTGRGCTPPWIHPPLDTPSSGHPLDGHCSGRHASYWNAFLFIAFLRHKPVSPVLLICSIGRLYKYEIMIQLLKVNVIILVFYVADFNIYSIR